jgi:aryl-alcohol dehydrogenase-like predicted oxidoreductase
MEFRPLGRTDVRVSSICLGTMMYGDQISEADAFEQMDIALERGINFFDTAEMYTVPPKPETQGNTERIIGNWFKARPGARQKVVLASKIAGSGLITWARTPETLDNGLVRHTRKQIDYAVEQSLKRLQVETIDLYQLHWPDRRLAGFGFQIYKDYPEDFEAFEAILEHLSRHVEAGRIRHIGVSNESPWGVMRFLAESEKRGLSRMASIQNAYNLVNRRFETGGLAEIALREQVGLLAYSPLGQGYLTGKYRDGALPVGSRKAMFQRLGRYEGPGAQEMINAYLDCAKKLGVTPEALSLKFCETRPWVTSVIFGAASRAQLEADLDAFNVTWTEEMEREVNALHAGHPDPCP